MSANHAETKQMRLKVFFIGSFIAAFVCAVIYLFVSAYDDKDKMLTEPLHSDDNKNMPVQNKSGKWH
ncbi:hypothetical protein [Silvanigrella aquatica]|uniref:Uncharacterized protein n=1 Tax=Silvanigrella aquatica TaxID=1915309 RepID=A0A1L4D1S9_9BACT|nr:hypothetical protein [Silvanigrella aquatica]APJ04146.1 hypothetical protein AXG55_09610 [Silvanigrella aquatica]